MVFAPDDGGGCVNPYHDFMQDVRALLDTVAADKGYNVTGPDGPNALFDFIYAMSGPGHALGEIVYKARRYAARHNREDLLKIAAWAFLLWNHGRRQG